MNKLYIIGDEDSPLAVPVRISNSSSAVEGERLWAELEIDDAPRFMSHVRSCFGDRDMGEGSYGTCAQQLIERTRTALDDGDLSDCVFSLSLFDWHVPNTTTVFARRPTVA